MRLVLALSCLVLASACGSSQPEPAGPPVAAEPVAAPTPAGEDSITADELRAHVVLLASDEYAGRETLTEGAEKAAAYLSEQFESYGLRPLPGRESFEVPYTLEKYTFSPETNRLSFTIGGREVSAVLGADYTPFNFSSSGEAKEVEVVFAGYGITAPEHGWDDYRGLDVEGKVVLVLRHWPHEAKKDEAKGANPLASGNYGLFTTKFANAAKHGAVGMLLVTDPLNHEVAAGHELETPEFVRLPMTDEEKARLAKAREQREKAQAERASGKGKGKGKGGKAKKGSERSEAMALHISQKLAAQLIPDLAEVQKKLDAQEITPGDVEVKAVASLAVEQSKEAVEVHPDNVVGYLEGSHPELKKELVVIGGHYDHLGQRGPAEGHEDDNIFNGADDNASGTAGILELAQAFATRAERPARSLVFVGFSGEEKGLLGSYAMLREGQLAEKNIRFMLNLDMIGRNPEKPVEIVGEAYGSGLREILEAANGELGLEIELGGTNYSGNSDHHPFYQRDIPMMFFFTGLHDDYHGRLDHADKLDYGRMEKIVRLGYRVIEPIASGEVTPSFIYNLMWLGARIETSEGRPVFTGVEEGSRAARAGIQVGDVVVALGGEKLAEPRDVGKGFRAVEPGAKVALGLERDGEPVSLEVVRAKRGFLGIFPGPVSEEQRAEHGLAEDEGVAIRDVVAGGPAVESGIEKGDILIRIAGEKVGLRSLGRHLSRIGAGEKVHIVVIRGKDRKELSMVLGERE